MSGMGSGWRGVYPVICTPFDADDRIDHNALAKELGFLFENGASGAVVAMVSEVLRLGDDERRELVESVCSLSAGRGQVVASAGAESSRQAARRAREAAAAGADAVIAIPPVSSATGSQTFDYYAAIADAVEVPLIVQDASAYVGAPMPIELQASLLDRFGAERVMFKPEVAPAGPRLTALLEATGGQARVFDGSGGIGIVDAYRRGAVGTMPGPEICWALAALWEALEQGDDETIYDIAPTVALLVSLQASLDAFVAVEKYLLVRQGIFSSARTRGPVDYVLDRFARDELDRLFSRLVRLCRRDASGLLSHPGGGQ